MSAYQFGVGSLFTRRTDTAQPTTTPVQLGVLQDIDLSFDQTIKELMGQFKVAVDEAQGQLKISAKAKYARIQATIWNDVFFGQTQTTAVGNLQLVAGETAVVGATVTVAHGATMARDLGVTYSATGVALVKVASAPPVGSYSVNEVTGVYTFNAAEIAGTLMAFNYTWTDGVVARTTIAIANQLMGVGPVFELHLGQSYKNNLGTLSTPYYKFNACKASKLHVPFKNGDYMVAEVDIMIFADAGGNIGQIVLTE